MTLPWFIYIFIGICIGAAFGILYPLITKADGVIHVDSSGEKDRYLFEFNVQPEKIPGMNLVVFKVKQDKFDQS